MGIGNTASYTRIIGKYVHDIPAPHTPAMVEADYTWNYYSTGNSIIGNVVCRCGIGVHNHRVHGIYVSDPNETIQNNITYGNTGWGITDRHVAPPFCSNQQPRLRKWEGRDPHR